MIYLQSIFVQFNVDQYIWNHMFSCAMTHLLIKIEILNWKFIESTKSVFSFQN